MRDYFGQQTPFCLPFLFSVLTSKGRQYFPGLWIARCSWKVFLTIFSQILNNFEQLSPCCRILPHRNIFQRHIVHNRSRPVPIRWLPPLTVLDLEGNLPRNLPWWPSHNWDTLPQKSYCWPSTISRFLASCAQPSVHGIHTWDLQTSEEQTLGLGFLLDPTGDPVFIVYSLHIQQADTQIWCDAVHI